LASRTENAYEYFHHDVSKLLSYEEVFYITERDKKVTTENAKNLFVGITRAWPLFVIAISLAICAGTIMWISVCILKPFLRRTRKFCLPRSFLFLFRHTGLSLLIDVLLGKTPKLQLKGIFLPLKH